MLYQTLCVFLLLKGEFIMGSTSTVKTSPIANTSTPGVHRSISNTSKLIYLTPTTSWTTASSTSVHGGISNTSKTNQTATKSVSSVVSASVHKEISNHSKSNPTPTKSWTSAISTSVHEKSSKTSKANPTSTKSLTTTVSAGVDGKVSNTSKVIHPSSTGSPTIASVLKSVHGNISSSSKSLYKSTSHHYTTPTTTQVRINSSFYTASSSVHSAINQTVNSQSVNSSSVSLSNIVTHTSIPYAVKTTHISPTWSASSTSQRLASFTINSSPYQHASSTGATFISQSTPPLTSYSSPTMITMTTRSHNSNATSSIKGSQERKLTTSHLTTLSSVSSRRSKGNISTAVLPVMNQTASTNWQTSTTIGLTVSKSTMTRSITPSIHVNTITRSLSSAVSKNFPTKDVNSSDEKSDNQTALIVGLTVGLAVAILLFSVIVICLRRKRASYQYNVFYDEQNIVMNPFDRPR